MPTTNKPSQDLATYVEFTRFKGGIFPSLTCLGEVVGSKSSGIIEENKNQLKTLKFKIFIRPKFMIFPQV